jgi:hypothetical protein
LVHLSTPRNTRPDVRPSTTIYYFSETATNLFIEDLFNAIGVHNFIMHQRIKLVFQQVPFSGRRHLSLHMTDVSGNEQSEEAFICGLCKSVLAALVPLRKN